MKRTSLFRVALGAVIILGVSFWGARRISATREEAQRKQAGPRSAAVPVRTDRGALGEVRNVLTFNGDVEPMRSVDLQAKVAGRLLALELEDGTPVEEGTPVKKGQRIALLDGREYHAAHSAAKAAVSVAQASLASARAVVLQRQASLASAQANLEDKQREFQRMSGLVAQQAGTQQSLDQATTALAQAQAEKQAAQAQVEAGEAALEQAQATLEQAQAEEEKANLDVQETMVCAPMDGVVSRRHLDPGVQVTASTPLVTILAMDTVKVVISVPVNRLSQVVPGTTQATLRSPANPQEVVTCLVEKIYPAVDTVTRTAQVELRVPNRRREDGTYPFLPGMYATVELLLEVKEGIVTVDVSLPIRNVDRQLVFVCQGDTVRAVPVTLGLTTGGQVEVLEGLHAGDEVVVQGQHRLTDGSVIRRIAAQGEDTIQEGVQAKE